MLTGSPRLLSLFLSVLYRLVNTPNRQISNIKNYFKFQKFRILKISREIKQNLECSRYVYGLEQFRCFWVGWKLGPHGFLDRPRTVKARYLARTCFFIRWKGNDNSWVHWILYSRNWSHNRNPNWKSDRRFWLFSFKAWNRIISKNDIL